MVFYQEKQQITMATTRVGIAWGYLELKERMYKLRSLGFAHLPCGGLVHREAPSIAKIITVVFLPHQELKLLLEAKRSSWRW
jgi:hypothetical protein